MIVIGELALWVALLMASWSTTVSIPSASRQKASDRSRSVTVMPAWWRRGIRGSFRPLRWR